MWCNSWKKQRSISYTIHEPTLQLDNCEILSIEILFHMQHHIGKSTKAFPNPENDKESMSLSR